MSRYRYLKFSKARVEGEWKISDIQDTEFEFECRPKLLLAALKAACKFESTQKTYYKRIGDDLIAVCTKLVDTPIFLVREIKS